MAPHQINIHFVAFTNQPPFASKHPPARIDYLHAGKRLVDKKGTHNVKIRTKNKTFWGLVSVRFSKLVGMVYLGYLAVLFFWLSSFSSYSSYSSVSSVSSYSSVPRYSSVSSYPSVPSYASVPRYSRVSRYISFFVILGILAI